MRVGGDAGLAGVAMWTLCSTAQRTSEMQSTFEQLFLETNGRLDSDIESIVVTQLTDFLNRIT